MAEAQQSLHSEVRQGADCSLAAAAAGLRLRPMMLGGLAAAVACRSTAAGDSGDAASHTFAGPASTRAPLGTISLQTPPRAFRPAAAAVQGRSAFSGQGLMALPVAAAVLWSRSACRHRGAPRRLAATASTQQANAKAVEAQQRASAKAEQRRKRREDALMLEAALMQLFEKENISIFKVRDCLARLAALSKRPNSNIAGEWIIFWASKEGIIDREIGTGITVEWYFQLQEYLIRFTSRKEGRKVEAAEVLRKVGPFPNQYNRLTGTYETVGTNGLRINFDKIQTDDEKDVEVEGKIISEQTSFVDVIYSSEKMLAIQVQDSSGECDFFVFTPVDFDRMLNKLLGLERRRFLFN